MPQCCYLAKGAKRPSHTTNTIKFDRIPFDPCNSIKRFDLSPFDQKNSTYLQPPVQNVAFPLTGQQNQQSDKFPENAIKKDALTLPYIHDDFNCAKKPGSSKSFGKITTVIANMIRVSQFWWYTSVRSNQLLETSPLYCFLGNAFNTSPSVHQRLIEAHE